MRRLQGISYWVIEDPDGIADLVNNNIRTEWEADARSVGREPREDPWLQTLSRRRWSLNVLEENRIVLNPETLHYVDERRGYSFQESLARRSKELRSVIETYGVVIWPLIVRAEDMMLADGYCRLRTLREMDVSKVYAYLGSLNDNTWEKGSKSVARPEALYYARPALPEEKYQNHLRSPLDPAHSLRGPHRKTD